MNTNRQIFLNYVSTTRTYFGRVARINLLERNPVKPALVFDLRPQIGEGPRVQDAALLFRALNPVADACQVLDGHSAPGAFSNTGNLFGNHMVLLAHKPRLTPAQASMTPPAFAELLLSIARTAAPTPAGEAEKK